MTRGRRFVEAAATMLAFAFTALAQEYRFRVYGPDEGLKNLVILSLAQDHAGYIWAGTEVGLYLYNGRRFQLMGEAEGLPCSTEVHGLFVAADGALWVNTCSGILRFDGKRFEAVGGLTKMLRGAQVMADGAHGSVLITTHDGLYDASRGPDGTLSTHSYPLPSIWANKPMHGIVRDGTRVWFGCDRQLCMAEAGQVSVFGKDQGLPADAWDGIRVSPDGAVWARSPQRLYRRAHGETRFSQENPEIASSGFWGALTRCLDGSIMVPTDQGVAIHGETGWNLVNRRRGLPADNTTAVLEDREGSVWIGLAGGGVARWLGRGIWECWTRNQGLPADIIWNIKRDRAGFLWVGTSLGLTRIGGSGRMKTWTKRDGLTGENVRWLAETSDGSIWAAMKPGGLARINPVSGKVRLTRPEDGLQCDPEDLFVDRHDRMWLPTACGLYLNELPSTSNRVTRVNMPASFGLSARKVLEDKQGTIWVTNRTSLWSLREGHWREYRRGDGLLTDNPYVMALAGDGSIWLRHRFDAGIDRLEVSGGTVTRATAVVPADPKAAAATAFHGFDAFGNLWRGSTNGVAVLHGGTWTTFTTEDGLVSNDCDGEAFWADPDGSVWLGTSGGLAHYRSATGVPRPLTGDPTIVRLEINQQNRLVRAEFSSLNYKAEQLVHFAYKLDRTSWAESLDRNISVSGLGPGAHRLEVRCWVRDGPPSPRIAAAEFRIVPKWDETWWARLLIAAFMVAAIMRFVSWRLSVIAQKQVELQALVAARTKNLIEVNRSLDEVACQLRISEDRLKNAERLAHLGHWDWDMGANRLSWSEEMFRLFDVPPDYTPSYERFVQVVITEDRNRFEQWVKDCLEQKRGISIDFQICRPNGDVRIVSCTSEVSLDEAGSPIRFFGACQDITDTRRAQQEDFVRKKLESIGTLASGIAHDFNNLLGGVLAQAEVALASSNSASFPKEELISIRNVATRGSEIVRQLLTYAGKETDAASLTDVSKVIAEMHSLLLVSISKRATLTTDLGQNLPPVPASTEQIRQIVMNLVTNASEAIGDNDGEVRLVTTRVTPGRGTGIAKGPAESYSVQLEVSDSGCGIPPDAQARVFEPFFSSKGPGHGLGLAVVHGIVRSVGGMIHVVSEPGRGTAFQVLLPSADRTTDASRFPAATAGELARSRSDRAVLLVEDEDPLRQAVGKMLRKNGFIVLEAADGAAAIELLHANGTNIDVILLDITIPGASSHEVVAEAEQFCPNARIILTSAYALEMVQPPIDAPQVQGFIRKPYRLADLVQILRTPTSS